nr:hypothetical protein GZ27E7_30 [uncultured archaeon GZfos27E7]
MVEDGEVRPEGGVCEPCSDILPNWKDIRSEFGYTTINKITPLTLRNFAYLVDMQFSSVTQMPSALRISAVPLGEILALS